MKYVTNDGREFKNLKAAKAHEEDLIERKKEENRLEKEKIERQLEIKRAYDNYIELRRKYIEDYKIDTKYSTIDIFNAFFS